MTIAACYLSSEGVVFGADSTTTIPATGQGMPARYYDYAQKIFEVGEYRKPSTLGIVMWGMGSLPNRSHRTLIAEFADTLRREDNRPDLAAVAERWSEFFWKEYTRELPNEVERARELHKKLDQTELHDAELMEFEQLARGFSGGFCLGGNLGHDRTPEVFEIIFEPWLSEPSAPDPLTIGRARFWGCPNLTERILYGIDLDLLDDIRRSDHWKGTEEQLRELHAPYVLDQQSRLPIREAIDWVYASIYSTIKSMKYSQLDRVCGGPIEVAVITADRPFRWVRHKKLGAAIREGSAYDELLPPAE